MVLCLSKLWFILDQPQSLYFSQGSSGQARLFISSLMELARSRAIEQHIDVHLSLIRSKKSDNDQLKKSTLKNSDHISMYI